MANVFVVGAGPAGLFAAQKIALAGHQVTIFNRDIKPGGLAEYGIYPVKDKMKFGLRKQFAKVLGLPNVRYFGHVPVGQRGTFSIDDLRTFGPAAMVFAVGAQGTKKLGLPGEDAAGIYSAKDFVYHYNLLPPFATRDFSIGRRVAIVGMGNVMVDIARWLLLDNPERRPLEIVVVARRGPFEAKFDEKEFVHIEGFLDRVAFQQELARVKERLAAVGQDIAKVPQETFPVLGKPATGEPPQLQFRFLASPRAIQAGPDGRIQRLTIAENRLVEREGALVAEATDQANDLEVDTMIFAIGDVADPAVGLPYAKSGYVTNPDSCSPHAAYEVFDPQSGKVVPGTYVVGWARQASTGLVGIARHDAEHGADHVLAWLESAPQQSAVSEREILARIQRKGLPVVTTQDLGFLGSAESAMAAKMGVGYFKFGDDASMLAAIERERSAARVPTPAL